MRAAKRVPQAAPVGSGTSVAFENGDVRYSILDGRLDAEDLARVLMSFRGQPKPTTGGMRYQRLAADLNASVYVIDGDSGMAYLLV
jgi:hypothetical protein